jgi:hypothetical protein
MEFSDGLADNGERGGGARSRGQLLVDVESGLVLLATLQKRVSVSFFFAKGSGMQICIHTTRMPTQDSAILTSKESCAQRLAAWTSLRARSVRFC